MNKDFLLQEKNMQQPTWCDASKIDWNYISAIYCVEKIKHYLIKIKGKNTLLTSASSVEEAALTHTITMALHSEKRIKYLSNKVH